MNIAPLQPFFSPALPMTAKSPPAHIIKLQEWLVVRGYDVGLNKSQPRETAQSAGIDGGWGNLTETALRNFAHDNDFKMTPGVVDDVFWFRLTAPLANAMSFQPKSRGFGAAMVETAQAWLTPQPKEARVSRDGLLYGQDNSGPWVDAFNHGVMAAWCLGAVDSLIEHVSRALMMAAPLDTILDGSRCLWVPRMVDEARRRGIYLGGSAAAANPSALKPGSVFFLRSAGSIPYIHTGIVESVMSGGMVATIEGNTNTGGSPEGWLFMRRQRGIQTCDYAVMP